MSHEEVLMIFLENHFRYLLQAFDSVVLGNQLSAVGCELLTSNLYHLALNKPPFLPQYCSILEQNL